MEEIKKEIIEETKAEDNYLTIKKEHADLTCLMLSHVNKSIIDIINELHGQGAENNYEAELD